MLLMVVPFSYAGDDDEDEEEPEEEEVAQGPRSLQGHIVDR